MNILGVKIDNLFKKDILKKVDIFLNEPKFHQIATINPEFILEAQKNKQFKDILNGCDLNIADGIGLKFAFWRYGKNLKFRIVGADLMLEILKMANDRKLNIFLACQENGLSNFEEIKSAILKLYPNITISEIYPDCHPRPVYTRVNSGRDPVANPSVSTLDSPAKRGNDKYILLCNYGAPQQEIFINSQKSDIIRLAMGVGGSFDYLTGKIKRAPRWMRFLGFEWLWRLIQQPKRWKRIWNAVIIFPMKAILCKKK